MYMIKYRPETQTETKIQDFKINRKLEKWLENKMAFIIMALNIARKIKWGSLWI